MRRHFKYTNTIKHFAVFFLTMLYIVSTLAFFEFNVSATPIKTPDFEILEFEGTYDWETTLDVQTSSSDYITYTEYRDTYCLAASTASSCASAANGKKIRFDNAEELYRWSMDVSFEEIYITGNATEDVKLANDKIAVLLSLDYVLGNNIDYSVMQSKAFIPIGFAFTDVEENVYERSFTGSFDGQGFEINRLYVAGYSHLIYVDEVDEITTIDIALSEHYSMFNYNEGTIKNVGLINPNLEILELHTDITKCSNLVGFNMSSGIVQNVYVIDNRSTVTTAGIRYQVGTSSEDFEAAGIIHTNQGTFTDAYYVSLVVVNGNYINKFDVQPVLYTNTGTASRLVYDDDIYQELVTVGGSTFIVDTPNAYATAETTSVLKSSSSLSTGPVTWYYYPSDRYPMLQGFDWDETNEVYEIDSPLDLAFIPTAITLTSLTYTKNFAHHDYVLLNDIDMSTLAADVYQTPEATFYGSISGLNPSGSDLSDNYYIYNLDITNNILRGSEYYAGLFSVLGAGSEISNLNFSQSSVTFVETEDIYSYDFFIGSLAGKMTGGTISNVLLDVDIDLGTEAIGTTYAGGVVGKASGVIEYTSNFGDLVAGNHVFSSAYSIEPLFHIGGIVGAAAIGKLTLEDVVNHGTIYGMETASSITLATGYTRAEIRMGGVIGYISNSTGSIHELINVANHGDIYSESFNSTVGTPAYQYIGGVFGKLDGLAPILEVDDEYRFANLYNAGDIYHDYLANTATVLAAGIGINNASANIEYALLFNHGTFSYNTGAATYTQTQFDFVTLLFDIGNYDITISRAYNYADLNYDSNVYYHVSGMYESVNDNDTLLRYVANFGDINYLSNSGNTQISLATDLHISGITHGSNIDYLNVYNYGNISIVNINVGTYDMFIAGFNEELDTDRYIRNSLNDGDFTIAEISGSGNIYVAGFVNTNLSGDLQDAGQSTTQPTATVGIINSINSGNFTTSYGLEAAGLYGINGTSNMFIGGIVSLNKGSIQHSANLGDIKAYNSNSSSSFSFLTDSYYAGLVSSYNSGIVAGGISSVVIGGDSRIYDTANNGNVVVLADKYVRAGGILGVALYDELEAGGITTGMGMTNDIENSVLSNGLNFGNILAISNVIATYSTSTYNTSFALRYGSGTSYLSGDTIYISTVYGNAERPTIYSSAGGVIGYGLSVMQRMLNHGTVGATDVAGGVVGATYVLGGSSTTTTVVNITTAINYGDIKSISNSNYSAINKYALDYSTIESNYFMADGNTFIFPTHLTKESPGAKRGFGGIFGRLQRGLNGVMTSEGGQFDFIVNANENIDLIGRLDQVDNFSSSSRYFRFNDAIYYSAKLNDTTQAVFTGFYVCIEEVTSVSGSRYNWTIYYDEILYEQVGIVMTEDSTLSTGNYFRNTSSRTQPYYAGDILSAYYYDTIDVPWITEDPSDPNLTNSAEEYMYDSSFPMRTDPDLTEYIYYMPNDLLASRFTTTRPNGMYVLSTSAGQSYGSVIPKNIDVSYIRMINEDYTGFISLYMDYSIVSPVYKEDLPTIIENSFDSLKQTTFNDKSELIPNDSVYVTIEEDGGSNNTLSMPTIDYLAHTITFKISMEAFNSSQTTATFMVTDGLTSSDALIAIRAEDYYGHAPSSTELEAFNNLLYPERSDGISTNYPAALSVTLPSHDITSSDTRSIGYFTVYSEAFIGDDLYATSVYYTDYQVYIEFTPNSSQLAGTTEIETVEFNGGAPVTVIDITDVRNLGDVYATGSITLNFVDNKGIFSQNYDFKDNFVVKYYDGSTVDEACYTVTSTPVDIISNIGYYDITFTFNVCTRTGDYYFEYSYFPTSTVFTTYFDKSPSSGSDIIDFTYYSEADSIVFNGLTITSYINLETDLSVMDTSSSNFSSTLDSGVPTYASNYTYDIDFMTSGSLEISPFASVVSARLVQVTITNGYKTYQMEYIIQAEDTTQSIYTHYIIERDVDLVSVLKNGNDVQLNDIHLSREATSTIFTVDLGFDQNLNLYIIDPGAYSYLEVSVTGTTNDGLTTYTPEEIVGITYSVSDYLYITFTYQTLPGIYTFSFTYYRDGSSTEYVTFATNLVITKDLGENAYLTDIQFSELANETTYPDMYITDVDGEIISSSYDPAVYFDGIDYDGSDDAGYPYFRIDGRVSNVPLDSYVPFFLDYLPYGATISRYAYDTNTTSWYWTDEADASSDASVLGQLETDFTVFPDTLLEPGEGEYVMVKYRVTAEDGLTQVYYYITVTDVTYNLSIVFDIYYCTDETQGSCVLANQSVDFSNELVIVTVKNLDTNGDDTVYGVTDPDNYPTFSVVNGLNNRTTQFYYTSSADYKYKFGRNMAGFYTFDLELPLDQYLNDLYTYEIEYDVYYLNDASDYVADLNGKYFYIEYATTIRTRRFNVYIRPIASPSTDVPFGLFDFFKSWFE